jgi:hypothetical protein
MTIPGIRKHAKGPAANLPCGRELDGPPKHEALCARATGKAGSSAGWWVSGDIDLAIPSESEPRNELPPRLWPEGLEAGIGPPGVVVPQAGDGIVARGALNRRATRAMSAGSAYFGSQQPSVRPRWAQMTLTSSSRAFSTIGSPTCGSSMK